MLDVVVPATFIGAAIRPDHLSFTVALIVSVLTDVLCATVPNEVALPVASVLRKLTLVCVALLSAVAAPLSETVLLPLVEFSRIVSPAFPCVCALTLWLTVHILPGVCVACCGEFFCALTMF